METCRAMDPRPLHLRNYLFSGYLLISVILLAVMLYLVYSGDRLASRHAPLVDAVMEIKLNAALGHLWFEEIISGDRRESITEVWHYLDEADWYALAMLEGGENSEGVFLPLSNPEMRATIMSVRTTLAAFHEVAQNRFARASEAQAGSELDQHFDAIFASVMAKAEQVETLLQKTIAKELAHFRNVAALLIGLAILISALVAYLLLRMERQRHLHLSAIELANAEIKEQHSELNYLAHFDPLTDLPNRALLLDRLEQAIAHARRKNSHIALLFVDLDQFKSVNDRFGHPAGDALLVFAADRLRGCIRADDTVARLGGDEFTVILTDIKTRERALSAAEQVSTKVLQELTQPFSLGAHKAHISASVGIAIYPDDGEKVDELLINADRAMLEIKNQGKNNFRFHSNDLNERAKRHLRIESELRDALERDQLTLHYQPQWDMRDGRLAGIEALVRWQHPKDGLIQPGDFIPIAAAGILIEKLDAWVLERACRDYRSWRKEGLKPGKLCVNLSPMTFRRPDLTQIVSSNIAKNCLRQGELELELTESALLENTSHTRDRLEEMKNWVFSWLSTTLGPVIPRWPICVVFRQTH